MGRRERARSPTLIQSFPVKIRRWREQLREENPHLSQSRSGNGDEGGGGRSGPKIDAKESGQHLQAESKTDGETDVSAAGGRRGTDGRRGKGGREREGREHLRISLKKPSEKERGREREGGGGVEELKFLAWRCSC